ncbi:SymE family type I addiction module toxin [Polluticaenibacter yanchengensis]|uniref:Type I addiction module toxin, SymE family n=1 Tax=Polluticaenibacter yanchengensis TaxID=3014562 RepID=A0ABT4UHQ5_9BACT|nr:hypothetical protein [Chitinophagaceae bacterium LY-5]
MAANNKPSKRQMTICSKAFGRVSGSYMQFPIITLNSMWLQDMDFKIGQLLDIVANNDQIIITVAKEQKYSEIEKLMNKGKIEIV